METSILIDIFQTRIEEHALSIRAKVAGVIEILPHLCTLGMRSSAMMKQAREQANIRYLSNTQIPNKKGLKETLIDAQRKEPFALNSDGEVKKYDRQTRTSGIPWNPNGQPTTVATTGGSKLQCVRFIEFGHRLKDNSDKF